MSSRTRLHWSSGRLHFDLESCDCTEDAIHTLASQLRARLEADHWNRAACASVGQELWRWLDQGGGPADGGRQWLRSALAKRLPQRPWRLEVGGDSLALIHLPWELLHDGQGFLAARMPAFVPLRRVDDAQSPLPEPSAPPRFGLALLFMAAAPPTQNPLHFEEEERRILDAIPPDQDLRLEVEESGTLDGLQERCGLLEDWSVVHVSCHGTNAPPELVLETDEGGERRASPEHLAYALGAGMPRLMVVSACTSAACSPEPTPQDSLARRLVAQGLPAVLGFGAKVRDDEAIALATELYRALARSVRLDDALAQVRAAWLARPDSDPRTWGSLRLFTQVEPGKLVPPQTAREHRAGMRAPDGHAVLSGLGRSMPIAHPIRFVGRRRELQRALKALRHEPGVVLQGLGGVGKSSIAGRLLSRMSTHRPVTVVGPLDRALLLRTLREAYLGDRDVAARLHDDRIREVLDDGERLPTALAEVLAYDGVKRAPPLFVFDDAEVNMVSDPSRREKTLQPEAERCLNAVLRAVVHGPAQARVVVTSRYAVQVTAQTGQRLARLVEVPIAAPSERDQAKLLRRADRYDDQGQPRPRTASALSASVDGSRALELAGANPRLLALVHRVWVEDETRAWRLLDQLQAYRDSGKRPDHEEAVRDLLITVFEELLALAGGAVREHLGALASVEVPIPTATVAAVLSVDAKEVARWLRLALLELDLDGDVRVPELLRPMLRKATDAETRATRALVWTHLPAGWKESAGAWTGSPQQAHFVARACKEAGGVAGSREKAALRLAIPWLIALRRDGDARDLSEMAKVTGVAQEVALSLAQAWASSDAARRDEFLAMAQAAEAGKGVTHQAAAVEAARGDALMRSGDLDGALAAYGRVQAMLDAATGLPDETRQQQKAVVQGRIADILEARGQLDEALRIRSEEELPVYERLGDVRSRAVTQRKIADILQARGQLDEALKLLRDDALPAAQKLGAVADIAAFQGRIADILQARGQLDEALRIRREEQLPVFERLGDVREWAVTQGKIADILQARGQLDEALRIRREEELPVFERLGDVRERAVTQGQIADILEARGQLDEALRIRREEELPVYERLGDVRSRAVTQGKIADILQARGQLDEALRIRREEQLPVYERLGDVRSRAVTQGKIADILEARGQLDEALRIRREEQLPVYERLGDVRSRAITQGKIADILQARGQLDEALRIRREEQLPVYERLGDVRSRAVTMGRIADVLQARGQLDEALRIRREEFRVYEQLRDVQARLVCQTEIALTLLQRPALGEEDAREIARLLRAAYTDARRMGIPEAEQIRQIATEIGLPLDDPGDAP